MVSSFMEIHLAIAVNEGFKPLIRAMKPTEASNLGIFLRASTSDGDV